MRAPARRPRRAVGATRRRRRAARRSARAVRETGGCRCTGPVGRARACRRERARGEPAPPGVGAGAVLRRAGIVEPPHRVPEEVGLVDRLSRARSRAARAAGRRCTRAAERARDAPRSPPGADSRPRYPTCSTRSSGRPVARPRPSAAKSGRAFVDARRRLRGARRGRARASAACCATPGRRPRA